MISKWRRALFPPLVPVEPRARVTHLPSVSHPFWTLFVDNHFIAFTPNSERGALLQEISDLVNKATR